MPTTQLPKLTPDDVDSLLAIASGDISYQSDIGWFGVKTTATVTDGHWTSKQYASAYMDAIHAREIAARPKPVAPVATGKRSEPYTGPFPRGKHSHRCLGCGDSHGVACYRKQCAKPQVSSTCSFCKERY